MPPGRPTNNKIWRLDEPIAKKRIQKKCSKCGGQGHNKKTCKGLTTNDENGRKGYESYVSYSILLFTN